MDMSSTSGWWWEAGANVFHSAIEPEGMFGNGGEAVVGVEPRRCLVDGVDYHETGSRGFAGGDGLAANASPSKPGRVRSGSPPTWPKPPRPPGAPRTPISVHSSLACEAGSATPRPERRWSTPFS